MRRVEVRVVGVVVADEMSVLVVVVVADERMRWTGEVMKWLTNVVVPWVKSGRDRKKKRGPLRTRATYPSRPRKTKGSQVAQSHFIFD